MRKGSSTVIAGRPHRLLEARLSGKGMGSVLLDKGGAGSGSSYPSVQDYVATTGEKVKGYGLSDKLSKLLVKPITKKPKNINFSI